MGRGSCAANTAWMFVKRSKQYIDIFFCQTFNFLGHELGQSKKIEICFMAFPYKVLKTSHARRKLWHLTEFFLFKMRWSFIYFSKSIQMIEMGFKQYIISVFSIAQGWISFSLPTFFVLFNSVFSFSLKRVSRDLVDA